MTKPILTIERLRGLLNYAPETGVFTWIVHASQMHIGDIAGSVNGSGYLQIDIDGQKYKAHRLAWLYATGAWPTAQIDHVNGQRDDNRISNLRDVSRSVNIQNLRKARSDNKSGLLGVSANGNRWQAQINVGGKKRQIGTFATPELAHAAYLDAKRELHVGCTI